MDSRIRDAERAYAAEPGATSLVNLLRAYLRIGQSIELTSKAINDGWEEPSLKEFLATVPRLQLRVCDYELRRYGVTRTFLLGQIRTRIAEEINYLYDVHEVGEFHDAYGGEFSVMNTAFAPHGEGAGSFFVITLFDHGFAENLIYFDCEDVWSNWDVDTTFVDSWDFLDLTYSDSCGDSCSEECHGTEDHVFAIDDARAEAAERHYFMRLSKPLDFLDLKLRGY